MFTSSKEVYNRYILKSLKNFEYIFAAQSNWW